MIQVCWSYWEKAPENHQRLSHTPRAEPTLGAEGSGYWSLTCMPLKAARSLSSQSSPCCCKEPSVMTKSFGHSAKQLQSTGLKPALMSFTCVTWTVLVCQGSNTLRVITLLLQSNTDEWRKNKFIVLQSWRLEV